MAQTIKDQGGTNHNFVEVEDFPVNAAILKTGANGKPAAQTSPLPIANGGTGYDTAVKAYQALGGKYFAAYPSNNRYYRFVKTNATSGAAASFTDRDTIRLKRNNGYWAVISIDDNGGNDTSYIAGTIAPADIKFYWVANNDVIVDLTTASYGSTEAFLPQGGTCTFSSLNDTDFAALATTQRTLPDRRAANSPFLPLTGGTMTGNINMDQKNISNAGAITANSVMTNHLLNENGNGAYITADDDYVFFLQMIDMSGLTIENLGTAVNGTDAVNLNVLNSKFPVSVANGGTGNTIGNLPSPIETVTTAAQWEAIIAKMPIHTERSFIAQVTSGVLNGTNAPSSWWWFRIRKHENNNNYVTMALKWATNDVQIVTKCGLATNTGIWNKCSTGSDVAWV